MQPETDNFRVALARLTGTERGLRLAGALWRFWWSEGYTEEGRRCLGTMLRSCPLASAEVQIKALNGLSVFARQLGAINRAEEALAESRRLCHQGRRPSVSCTKRCCSCR